MANVQVTPQRQNILGIDFSNRTLEDFVEYFTAPTNPADQLHLVVTANVDHIVQLRRNDKFRKAYQFASTVTLDGFPLYLYAKLRGLKPLGRAAGSDLFPRLCAVFASRPEKYRLFFIVASQESKTFLQDWARHNGFEDDAVKIIVPPFGFERNRAFTERLAEDVNRHRSTHLFLGVGAPKSEMWVYDNRHRLPSLYAFCFGAGIEYFTGNMRRAPRIFRQLGFEWAWRIVQEPRRLFLRYFVSSWAFLLAIKDDLILGPVR